MVNRLGSLEGWTGADWPRATYRSVCRGSPPESPGLDLGTKDTRRVPKGPNVFREQGNGIRSRAEWQTF